MALTRISQRVLLIGLVLMLLVAMIPGLTSVPWESLFRPAVSVQDVKAAYYQGVVDLINNPQQGRYQAYFQVFEYNAKLEIVSSDGRYVVQTITTNKGKPNEGCNYIFGGAGLFPKNPMNLWIGDYSSPCNGQDLLSEFWKFVDQHFGRWMREDPNFERGSGIFSEMVAQVAARLRIAPPP